MSINFIIITCLSLLSGVAIFYAVRFGIILLRVQDAVEESLDVIDEKYRSMSEILERPLYYDSPEIRKVVQDIRDTRSAILYIANTLTVIDEEEVAKVEYPVE